jgi:5-methyltetrahydrofolate--homocysteine methyltransferase
MTLRLHFSPADWDRITRDYSAWWAHELDRPIVQITGVVRDRTVRYREPLNFLARYPLDQPAAAILETIEPHLEATRFYGDAYPSHWVNFGPGIMAGFLGSRVHPDERSVWFSPAVERRMDELEPAHDPFNPWWRRVLEWTQAALDAWGGQVQVGCADLGGNLDVIASLRGTQELLYDVHDAPEEVERVARVVTGLWLQYFDALDGMIHPVCRGRDCWTPIWCADTTYMLQCDFSYMISPRMFERFVLPDLAACCEHLGCAFYHLDGPGELPHVDLLCDIPRLRGIQWIPGDAYDPPEKWLALLSHIRERGKLVQVFVSAQGALELVRAIGGKGLMLTIKEQMSEQEAEGFLAEMRNRVS